MHASIERPQDRGVNSRIRPSMRFFVRQTLSGSGKAPKQDGRVSGGR
jgi:hypothetical protein